MVFLCVLLPLTSSTGLAHILKVSRKLTHHLPEERRDQHCLSPASALLELKQSGNPTVRREPCRTGHVHSKHHRNPLGTGSYSSTSLLGTYCIPGMLPGVGTEQQTRQKRPSRLTVKSGCHRWTRRICGGRHPRGHDLL